MVERTFIGKKSMKRARLLAAGIALIGGHLVHSEVSADSSNHPRLSEMGDDLDHQVTVGNVAHGGELGHSVTAAGVESDPLVSTEGEEIPLEEGVSYLVVLGDCETGDGQVGPPFLEPDWDYDGESGFDGGFQFHPTTWNSLTVTKGYGYAWQAPPEIQMAAVEELLTIADIDSQFPSCARRMREAGYIE